MLSVLNRISKINHLQINCKHYATKYKWVYQDSLFTDYMTHGKHRMETRKKITSSCSQMYLMSNISPKSPSHILCMPPAIYIYEISVSKKMIFLAFFFFSRKCCTSYYWFESLMKVYFAWKCLYLDQRRFFYVYNLPNFNNFTEKYQKLWHDLCEQSVTR